MFSSLSSSVFTQSLQSMPLCMRQAQAGLKRDGKLKHSARQQYGLFLKGGGLSMEDALVFFSSSYSRVMTPDQFQKGYAYNIRHM
jgi:DNA primase large subunit